MCYAILEISYATTERSTKNIENKEDFAPALAELQANPNVTKIRVFAAISMCERQSIWNVTDLEP